MGNVTPLTKAQAQLDAEAAQAQGFTDTDIANAVRFARQHGTDTRFTPERGWLVWDGARWATDDKSLAVQALAKLTAVSIYDEIKSAGDKKVLFQHARQSQSKKAIEAMLWLARCQEA